MKIDQATGPKRPFNPKMVKNISGTQYLKRIEYTVIIAVRLCNNPFVEN